MPNKASVIEVILIVLFEASTLSLGSHRFSYAKLERCELLKIELLNILGWLIIGNCNHALLVTTFRVKKKGLSIIIIEKSIG